MISIIRLALNFLQALLKPDKCFIGPVHMHIEPTTICNLDCCVCPRKAVLSSYSSMDNAFFENVIRQIKPLNVTYNGLGETLLDNGVLEKLAILKKHGCKINMTSNFTVVEPEHIEGLIKTGVDLLGISLDAPSRAAYVQVRGKDCFDTIINNLQLLIDTKRRLGSSLPCIRLSCIVHRKSINTIGDFCKLAKKVGADAVLFQLMDIPYSPEKSTDYLPQDVNEIRNKLSKTYDLCRSLHLDSNLSTILSNFKEYKRKLIPKPENKWSRKCSNPWFSIYVQVDGTLTPCCSILGQEYLIGNLQDSPFSTLWNNGRMKSFRKSLRKGKRPLDVCKTCVPFVFSDMIDKLRFTPNYLFRKR